MGVPLAWRNLTYRPVRLALFALGVCFAVMLMFVQLGCRNALLDSSVRLIGRLRADLVIHKREQTTVMMQTTFPLELVARARAAPGVKRVYPLYLEYVISELRHAGDGEDRKPAETVRVVAVGDAGGSEAPLLDLPGLELEQPGTQVEALRRVGTALFDRRARRDPGPASRVDQGWVSEAPSVFGPVTTGTRTELAGRALRVVGEFDLGVDFGADGTLVVSEETFGEYLRGPGGLGRVDLGLVQVAEGHDPVAVRDGLRELLADPEIEVLTVREYADAEQRFWLKNTPVGNIFTFGLVMGIVIGFVICYQILSSNISDNEKAYATLRALGYGRAYLVGVVVQESALLALLGFVPGLLVTAGGYALLERLTGLPLDLTWGRTGFVFLVTLEICLGAGLIASVKALRVDPAEVF